MKTNKERMSGANHWCCRCTKRAPATCLPISMRLSLPISPGPSCAVARDLCHILRSLRHLRLGRVWITNSSNSRSCRELRPRRVARGTSSHFSCRNKKMSNDAVIRTETLSTQLPNQDITTIISLASSHHYRDCNPKSSMCLT
jgi:hypothetical protein